MFCFAGEGGGFGVVASGWPLGLCNTGLSCLRFLVVTSSVEFCSRE